MKKCRVIKASGQWRVGQVLELTAMQRHQWRAFVEVIEDAKPNPVLVPDMLASAPLKAKRGRKRKVIL